MTDRPYSLPRFAVAFVIGLTVAASVSPAALAQWRASIRLGLTTSTLTETPTSDFSAVTRLSGGGHLSWLAPNGFLFEPGLQYVVKGADARGTFEGVLGDDPVDIDATFDLTYLEVPVFFGYVFQRTGNVHPKIYAGPVMAFKLDSRITYRAVAGGPQFSESDQSVEDRDLGIGAGLGVEWEIGTERIVLGVQSTFGLSNARTEKPEVHNRSIGFYTGIIF